MIAWCFFFCQGVIVLTRQWKNILYTPLLLEHNYKSKVMKPLNVTFALPDLLEVRAIPRQIKITCHTCLYNS